MSGVWLTDLADVLRSAGLTVVEMRYESGPYKGKTWRQVGFNGRGLTELRGVMWHHDASPQGRSGGCKIDKDGYGYAPTGALWWCMYVQDLAPAASLWIDYDGVVYIYAAGLANHAGLGAGDPPRIPANRGNEYLVGIEVDHNQGEGWRAVQIDTFRRATAAMMQAYTLDPYRDLTFHREYSPGRKTDPDQLVLEDERAVVAALMKDPRIAKIEKRIARAQRLRDRLRARGESTAGIPTKIRALREKLKKLGG